MKNILVAVDLSDLAASVIEKAVMMAKAFGSQVVLLHVDAPTPSYIGNEIGPPVVPGETEEEHSRIEGDIAAMATHIRNQGVGADFQLSKGPVIETIIEKAAVLRPDLIIMGAHNHGFLYKAFIGSVCSGVVKRSPCPVLIVPGK